MDTILIIEDNREIRENTFEILDLAGYKVFTACNGKAGFELAKKSMPDLIICDMLMPESDGITFLKLVKENKQTQNIPLICFSADSAPMDVQKGVIKGADEYLSKPFSSEDLLDAVARHLKNVLQ
jgi:CheY-like chemotaxis protein